MAEGAKGKLADASQPAASRSAGATRATARRDGAVREADHDAIDRLTDELLPSLIAKLGASGLGEIEVREGEWHVRLRGLGDGAGRARVGDRADRADRAGRAHPGHDGHGHAPAAVEAHRSADALRSEAMRASDVRGGDSLRDAESHRAVATSPAVGVFQPRSGVTAGTKVRAGDRLGHVDMLGVPQEVVAPVDGIVGASLVAPGEAVEYGQELIRIELAAPAVPKPAPVGVPVSVGPEAPA